MTDPERLRHQLIEYLQRNEPWMVQKLENLRRGDPLTEYDKSIIAEMKEAA